MTTELDALPESVKDALTLIDAGLHLQTHHRAADEVQRELLRLAEENARLRFELRDQQLLAKANAEHAIQRLARAEKAEARVQELERENGELRHNEAVALELWNAAIDRAERAESELAAVEKRIAEAPVARVNARNITEPLQLRDADPHVLNLHDCRVSLLPLDDEAKS